MRKNLKQIAFYISLVVLSVVIVACNGGGDSNPSTPNNTASSPESVARTVFTSLVKFDFDSVIPHVCPEKRAEFEQQFAELAPLLAEQAEAIQQLNIDLSNATFSVQNQTDTTAEVVVSGYATITDGETEINQDINTTDNEPLRLDKVGDTWYICSDLL